MKGFSNRPKPGPESERLKLDQDWERAVQDALKKKKPRKGWSEPKRKKAEVLLWVLLTAMVLLFALSM